MSQSLALTYEPRPADFVARIGRRPAPLGRVRARRHSGRRGLVLLAAMAVPAMAAPGQWATFDIGDAGEAQVAIQPMPFEKPGDSFPGSAFYYLAADDQKAYWTLGESQWHESDFSPLASDAVSDGPAIGLAVGPAARALRVDNSGVDRSRALQCLTAAIYYEARSEPDAGQRAVAQVVLNRVAHPSYPNTVCGVVFQGSERVTGCQFSFTCDGSMAKRPQPMFWNRAEDVARAALSGYVYSPVGLATHYHTVAVNPYWAPSLHFLGTIGAHRFYKFKGRAGSPGAFRFAYAGGEPVAAPHARSTTPITGEDRTLDPLAIQKAYEQGLQAARQTVWQPTAQGVSPVRPAPPPTYSQDVRERGGEKLYSGDRLPQTSGVKAEYANSGKWIERPGS
jgi:spore germination cell wall hydrolase CwlJ-like protein